MIGRRAVAFAGAVLAAPIASACELPARGERFETPGHQLALATEPSVVRPGTFFAVVLAVCPRDGKATVESVRIDARMPDHRHGMNYVPRVAAAGPGLYRAEGFMFHMPGRWEFVVELRGGGRSERATLTRRVE